MYMAVALLVWVAWIINTPHPPKGGEVYNIQKWGSLLGSPTFLLPPCKFFCFNSPFRGEAGKFFVPYTQSNLPS
jgi:hypothetical protein